MGEPVKNIVICCDGTGNDYARTPSNVWRLREILHTGPGEQHVCYEPGIGTADRPRDERVSAGTSGTGENWRSGRGFSSGFRLSTPI